jgi:HPt (histidine-containing phosphotransfer) domain-containing protein
MLRLFINENERRIRAVLTAADAGDSSTLRCETHAMKGSAAIVGAEHLRDLAADVELRILTGTIRDPQASARKLRDEFTAVVSTLRVMYPGLCPNWPGPPAASSSDIATNAAS